MTAARTGGVGEASASASRAGPVPSAMKSYVTSAVWNTGSARTAPASAFRAGMAGTAPWVRS